MVYETPRAIRQAIEARLVNEARERGVDVNRLRRWPAFERILVHLILVEPGPWVVKGGIHSSGVCGNALVRRETSIWQSVEIAWRHKHFENG